MGGRAGSRRFRFRVIILLFIMITWCRCCFQRINSPVNLKRFESLYGSCSGDFWWVRKPPASTYINRQYSEKISNGKHCFCFNKFNSFGSCVGFCGFDILRILGRRQCIYRFHFLPIWLLCNNCAWRVLVRADGCRRHCFSLFFLLLINSI